MPVLCDILFYNVPISCLLLHLCYSPILTGEASSPLHSVLLATGTMASWKGLLIKSKSSGLIEEILQVLPVLREKRSTKQKVFRRDLGQRLYYWKMLTLFGYFLIDWSIFDKVRSDSKGESFNARTVLSSRNCPIQEQL